jgi:hypothetical protein
MNPVGLGTKNHSAVEDQQQFSSESIKLHFYKISSAYEAPIKFGPSIQL